MKRRPPPPPADGIPEWVRRFVYTDWAAETRLPPAWWADSAAFWCYFAARRAWTDACRAWAAERPEVDLYRLHYP